MAMKEAAPRIRRIEHASLDERLARGRAARERTSPASHSGWVAARDRPDPVALLEEQNATREPDLVPVRHGRMMVSPLTYRGAAKGSALVELMARVTLIYYAQLCGWTLARAHARSGDPVAMAEHLGGDAFDRSIADFSERYADQNEKDYEEFVKAIKSGRLEAAEGV